jgi:hypothetical protein
MAFPNEFLSAFGFVCAMRGVSELRIDDLGPLWEHYVLNEIVAHTQSRRVRYWRDKQGHEVDFVLTRSASGAPIAVECKWSASAFEPAALRAFRGRYPEGENLVVANDVSRPFARSYGDVRVRFVGLGDLVAALTRPRGEADADRAAPPP